jgi:hypothetical protein
MNAKLMLHSLELNFWHLTILFLSTSPTLRYIAPRIYALVHSKLFNQLVIPSIVYAALGMSLGFVLGAFNFFD